MKQTVEIKWVNSPDTTEGRFSSLWPNNRKGQHNLEGNLMERRDSPQQMLWTRLGDKLCWLGVKGGG